LVLGRKASHPIKPAGTSRSCRTRSAWWAALEEAAKADAFFEASLGFIVTGTKP